MGIFVCTSRRVWCVFRLTPSASSGTSADRTQVQKLSLRSHTLPATRVLQSLFFRTNKWLMFIFPFYFCCITVGRNTADICTAGSSMTEQKSFPCERWTMELVAYFILTDVHTVWLRLLEQEVPFDESRKWTPGERVFCFNGTFFQ